MGGNELLKPRGTHAIMPDGSVVLKVYTPDGVIKHTFGSVSDFEKYLDGALARPHIGTSAAGEIGD